jgi:predicted nucleic acid-binding protein
VTSQFLDTNVLIYLYSSELEKAAKAEILLSDGGVISVQVLNEFTRVMHRRMGADWPTIDAYLTAFRESLHIVDLNLATYEAGIKIAKRYGFQIFDCMLLASALEAGCKTFLSEDIQHGQVIEDRLTIINPFL